MPWVWVFYFFFFSRVKEALGVFMCWFALIGDPRQPPKNSVVFWFLPSLFSCHSVSHWTSSPWEAQETGWSPTAPGKPFRDTDVWRTAGVLWRRQWLMFAETSSLASLPCCTRQAWVGITAAASAPSFSEAPRTLGIMRYIGRHVQWFC